MIRLIITAASLLLLAGCASTTHYHQAGVSGSDYYYADSDGYYDRTDAGFADSCSSNSSYDRYSYRDCQTLGWQSAGPYAYDAWSGGWAGWGYPYGYYSNPYLAYGGGWGGSMWLGLGGVSSWGYPGYYNPWFGPRWPYAVSYPVHRYPYRDRQDLHREQALQASGQRHRGNSSVAGFAANRGSAGGMTRQPRELRRQEELRRYPGSTRQGQRPASSQRAPSATNSVPRGRPTQGIPVNWPVNRRPTRSDTVSRRPVSLPHDRPTPRPSRNSDARISHPAVRSMPLPTQSAPSPRARPQSMMVPGSKPVARPVSRSLPSSQPATRTRPAPTPRASSRSSSSSSQSSRSAAPRGRPARRNRD